MYVHGLGPLGGVLVGFFKSSHMRRVHVGGGALWRGDGGAPAPYSFSTQQVLRKGRITSFPNLWDWLTGAGLNYF
jgi:hypothetical protein